MDMAVCQQNLFTKTSSVPDLACELRLPTPDVEHRTGSPNPGTAVHQLDDLGRLYLPEPPFSHL